MPSPLPFDGVRPTRLTGSWLMLLLIDFINPIDGSDKLAGPPSRKTANRRSRRAHA